MRLLTFRVRTLLILMAVVAIALWVERMKKDAARYRQHAARFAAEERSGRQRIEGLRSQAERRSLAAREQPEDRYAVLDELAARVFRARAEVEERRLPHFAGLRLKYERAARYPFLPVAPDPPLR